MVLTLPIKILAIILGIFLTAIFYGAAISPQYWEKLKQNYIAIAYFIVKQEIPASGLYDRARLASVN